MTRLKRKIDFPETLRPYANKGLTLFNNGAVKEVEFSSGTYQILVIDPGSSQDNWSFMQFDRRGALKDCFCSCEEGESGACAHLAAAFLRVYNGHPTPLHHRLSNSLWNQLCRLFEERLGGDPDRYTKVKKGKYQFISPMGKVIFSITGRTPEMVEQLKTLFESRKKETEETSLKFSNLTQDEILLWREGRPSSELRYELSFWSDLAKLFMQMQDDNKAYEIGFEYNTNHIPNLIKINFSSLEAEFYLSEANLPSLIPSLVTVESPLKVYNEDLESVESITYDPVKGEMNIEVKTSNDHKKAPGIKDKGIMIGNWIFVPKKGFFAQNHHELLKTPHLTGRDISKALDDHFDIFSRFLSGVALHREPIRFSYKLEFDPDWNLHVSAYAFEPGDLKRGNSRSFGKWIYLDDDGFFRVEEQEFEKSDFVIVADNVADFVRDHRVWFDTQEGFQTHLASVEAQLSYMVSDTGRLSFSRGIVTHAEGLRSKDFGLWVYMEGQGFYAKVSTQLGAQLKPGIILSPEQIPLFIRMNREELKLIPKFFSENCPLQNAGIRIEVCGWDRIEITPEYIPFPEYLDKSIIYYDDFVYVPGEGFCELPPEMRLPEKVRHGTEIIPSEVDSFISYELESLKKYAAFIDPKLVPSGSLSLIAHKIEKSTESGEGWYGLNLFYEGDHGSVPVTSLWAMAKKKRRFALTPAGIIDLSLSRFTWLPFIPKDNIDKKFHQIEMTTMELIRLNAYDEIKMFDPNSPEGKKSDELLKELVEFRIPDEPDVGGLVSQLRPYQQIGLRWLWFLYHHHLSGLLCDDMGLGKTHQAMALLASIVNEQKKLGSPVKCHFLVVCPTSVIYHWQEKLHEYFPGLRVCTFYGAERTLEKFAEDYDLLLTSYGVWRMENTFMNKFVFDLAIFDEIQIAKNHVSKVHEALLGVKSKMRLGLTGTPIENHLRELKALFDIVLPGYMPPEADYRKFFIKPIEKEHDVKRRALLQRFIKPFTLRRRKGDVLLDLPEKVEEIAHCDLLPEQAHLYQDVLLNGRNQILNDLKNDSSPIPYIHIFALLANLKQICDHPAVYHKTPEDYKNYQSGKWDLFVELLSEARESQQKVVVFSQYLHMLDIFEIYLKEHQIGFATIRGSTMDRGEQIHRFNNDPTCEVFIGSLQAAGLGIDLTAASVVIHYDRWWNAARENQATDRVHRIGQTKGVQVFKLVTKGTFEERIDAMILKKGQLMEDVIGIDEKQVVKQFSRRDLIDLLQDVDRETRS